MLAQERDAGNFAVRNTDGFERVQLDHMSEPDRLGQQLQRKISVERSVRAWDDETSDPVTQPQQRLHAEVIMVRVCDQDIIDPAR